MSYDEAVACSAGGVNSAVIERYSDCDYINVRMDSPILSQWRVYSAATLELVGVVRIYDTVTRCGDSRVPQIDAGINPIGLGCQPSTRVAACPAEGSVPDAGPVDAAAAIDPSRARTPDPRTYR